MNATTQQAIRKQFLAQVEQAAADLERNICFQSVDSDGLAYRQGQRDERARIIAYLQTWRESIPCGRPLEATRNALSLIIRKLQP